MQERDHFLKKEFQIFCARVYGSVLASKRAD